MGNIIDFVRKDKLRQKVSVADLSDPPLPAQLAP